MLGVSLMVKQRVLIPLTQVRFLYPLPINVVPSVMAAHLSVKQVGRVRFPGSTHLRRCSSVGRAAD